jgi:hypothetical protein
MKGPLNLDTDTEVFKIKLVEYSHDVEVEVDKALQNPR